MSTWKVSAHAARIASRMAVLAMRQPAHFGASRLGPCDILTWVHPKRLPGLEPVAFRYFPREIAEEEKGWRLGESPMKQLLQSIQLTNFLSYGPGAPAVKLLPLNVIIGPNGS